jgi:transposase
MTIVYQKKTPERMKRILQALELGATYQLAANAAGISATTLTRWMKEDEEFGDECRSSEGKAAVRWLAKIEQAASAGDWHAAAWTLERRFPRDYGKRIVEHEGTVDYVIDLSLGHGQAGNPALDDDGASTPLLGE